MRIRLGLSEFRWLLSSRNAVKRESIIMIRYLTAGESHGKGLTVILEGMPSGLQILPDAINKQLARRQGGYGRGGRMKIETDRVDITAGVRHGVTLGSPIALWVPNKDWQAWNQEMSAEEILGFESRKKVLCPRPGHADLSGGQKYQIRDLRNILERASARETTVRVAVGAVCREFLSTFHITIVGHVTCIGGVSISDNRPEWSEIEKLAEASPVRCIDSKVAEHMIQKIDDAKKRGDTVGGIFELAVLGLPVGLGSHVQWDRKLDGRLAQAILSIQAIKGVEFGLGFGEGMCFGSQAHDEIFYDKEKQNYFRKTNRSGGLEGGMTTGEPLVLRGVMKPIATLYSPLHSVSIDTKEDVEASVERSDTCAVPAAGVIAENVVAFEIARAFLEKFGGDSMVEIERNYRGYLEQVRVY